jgi:hypothetical protein
MSLMTVRMPIKIVYTLQWLYMFPMSYDFPI